MDLDAGWEARLDAYTDGLAAALRSAGWCGSTEAMGRYCLGLLLPGERKSMEPMAARIDPDHVQAQFFSLQRLITDSAWDHQAVLDAVRNFCLPQILTQGRLEAWIVDGTTFPKQGTHSVGVAHQYCGNLGKTCNCQEAVSISLANHFAGLPVAYRLYLPQEWTDDPARCKTAGIPKDVVFRKKWLLVEWPTEESKPTRYWLSTMPANIPIRDLVDMANLRWRIEQDYEELKQDVGLGDFDMGKEISPGILPMGTATASRPVCGSTLQPVPLGTGISGSAKRTRSGRLDCALSHDAANIIVPKSTSALAMACRQTYGAIALSMRFFLRSGYL